MPLYIGEYLADTLHLNTEQHGAYLLLLTGAWTRKGKLPTDQQQLAAIAHLDSEGWQRHRKTLLKFFTRDGEFYIRAGGRLK